MISFHFPCNFWAFWVFPGAQLSLPDSHTIPENRYACLGREPRKLSLTQESRALGMQPSAQRRIWAYYCWEDPLRGFHFRSFQRKQRSRHGKWLLEEQRDNKSMSATSFASEVVLKRVKSQQHKKYMTEMTEDTDTWPNIFFFFLESILKPYLGCMDFSPRKNMAQWQLQP